MSSLAIQVAPSPLHSQHDPPSPRRLSASHFPPSVSVSEVRPTSRSPSVPPHRPATSPSHLSPSVQSGHRTASASPRIHPRSNPLIDNDDSQGSSPSSGYRSDLTTASKRDSQVTDRSSSETTAVTIYSMYFDESLARNVVVEATEPATNGARRRVGAKQPSVDRSVPPLPRDSGLNHSDDASARRKSSLRRRSSAPRRPLSISAVAFAAENSTGGPTTQPKSTWVGDEEAILPYHRNSTAPGPSSLLRDSSHVDHPRTSVHASRPTTATSYLETRPHTLIDPSTLPLPLSRPHSQQRRIGLPSSPAPPDKSPDLSAASASLISLTSSHLSPPSNTLSHRGADEDADANHVRATYAHLEAIGGVPGDGFEEGIERTRARLPSTASRALPTGEEAPRVGGAAEFNEKEEKVLQSLDRYGFFVAALSTRQESRLAFLPAAPLARKGRPGKPPPAPPATQLPSPPELKKIPLPKPPLRESSRIAKWNSMMKPRKRDQGGNVASWSYDGGGANLETFKRRVWKGVPDRWRPAVWQMMIDRQCEARRPKQTHEQLATQYRDNIDIPSPNDVQIDLDVPRTISGHVLFHTRYGQGQRSLFHILHCFSLVCSECEYVQGMGPIAATLMFYLDPERAYAGLVRIHDQYEMHTVFQPGFPGLLEAIYIQERLIEMLMPAVYKSFQKHMISSTSYTTKWYITLFANSVPFQTQLRIWDAFLLEGRDVIIIVAVAILWDLKDYLASSQASFETILSLLSSFFVPEDEDALLMWIQSTLENKKIRAEMVKWRSQWKNLVKNGQDGKALL